MAYAEQKNSGRQLSRQGSVAVLEEQLELNFSVRNIPKLDLMSPSDPFIVISIKDEINNNYKRIATTEVVWDNPNADFSKEIKISYKFEEVQTIKCDIYDADTKDTTYLNKHDYIGYCEFIIGDLVTSNGQKLVIPIKGKNNKPLPKVKKLQPLIIIRSSEIDDNHDELELTLNGYKLPKMDWFGKIDAFFQVYRKATDGGWVSVYKSEVIKKNYNPKWKKFNIKMRRLCHGDDQRPILFKIFDWNNDAKPDYAGEFETDVKSLLNARQIPLKQRNQKTGKYSKKAKGEVKIVQAKLVKKYSFLQFLRGGMEVQLICAIDFTGSNGHPSEKNSLHYMGAPYYESEYLKVIKSVGRVLEPYDTDGNIAAYGFGANLNPHGKSVSHCFPLTLNNNNIEVNGIEGLIAAYKNALNRVQLYGPTYFSEIVSTSYASCIGTCTPNSQCYTILLIITDGVINDMNKTIDRIVEATKHPISIIIVGVGNANFDNMDTLDADEVPLRHSNGTLMSRDIVQFVGFNEFKNQPLSNLAKSVLEEVPGQVQDYMAQNNIKPLKPKLMNGPSVDNVFMKGMNMDYKEQDNNNNDVIPPAYNAPGFSGNNNNKQSSEGTITNANNNNNNNNNSNAYYSGNNMNPSAPSNPYY